MPVPVKQAGVLIEGEHAGKKKAGQQMCPASLSGRLHVWET
jgi:hypothetical protein